MSRSLIRRPRYVALTEKRSPMQRFLEQTASAEARGEGAYVEYDQQYRTMWKAAQDGLITTGNDGYGYGGTLTESGRAYLAKLSR